MSDLKPHEREPWLRVGAEVRKIGGDYTFHGIVRAVFTKRSGAIRVAVENREGLLHIFNQKQLVRFLHGDGLTEERWERCPHD